MLSLTARKVCQHFSQTPRRQFHVTSRLWDQMCSVQGPATHCDGTTVRSLHFFEPSCLHWETGMIMPISPELERRWHQILSLVSRHMVERLMGAGVPLLSVAWVVPSSCLERRALYFVC